MSLDFYLRDPDQISDGEDYYLAAFNITHNLNRMADAVGIYDCLWRPDEHVPPITTASECVSPLRDGLAKLRADPDAFRQLSASNGWGTYEQFVPWVAEVLAACEANPTALVSVSR